MALRRNFRWFAAIVCAAWLASWATAAPYDPPANYYNSATGTGATLKGQLQAITSSMTGVNYGNARFSGPITDVDPNAPGNILLIYNRASVSGAWDSGGTWNREHIWPVSRLGVSAPGNSTTNLSSDQFNLRPANPSINSSRGNKPFGTDATTGVHGHQGTYYYPGDADAGDVARAQFYMATRYSQLTLTNGSPSGTQMGDLSSLLNYHYRDVPDDFERRRNHAIYGLAGENSPAIANPYRQNNRNPYIDRPEFAWSVFVDQANDSQIAIDGAPAGADGGSSRSIDLGRVLVGAPVPAPQAVELDKLGADGTYYEIKTQGDATSSRTGRFNAFRMGSVDSTTFNVGLNASTWAAGLRSGAVIVDNLDVTTQGGAGRGANDANDIVNLSLSVLDHATPSFSGASGETSLVYDFGISAVGSPAPTFSFDVHNLSSMAGFTAGLDLDAIVGAGDVGSFSTDLATFGGLTTLTAGSQRAFTAAFDTSSPGAFAVNYLLSFSDEDLIGAAGLGNLSITLTGVVGIPEPATTCMLLPGLALVALRRRVRRSPVDRTT